MRIRITGIRRAHVSIVAMEVCRAAVGDIRVDTCVVRQAGIEGTNFPIATVIVCVTIGRIEGIRTLTIQAFVERSRITVFTFVR
jgi:hypothetical protein